MSGNHGQSVEVEGSRIYVAAQEIQPGELVDETMVKTEFRAKDAIPEGAVTDPKQFHDRALLVRAFPGDLILEAKLGEKGKFGAAATIPPGASRENPRPVPFSIRCDPGVEGGYEEPMGVEMAMAVGHADVRSAPVTTTDSGTPSGRIISKLRLRAVFSSGISGFRA